MRWRIGTMGFSYVDWRGVFYPEDLRPADRLAFYARHFDAIEIDSTWHAAPLPGRMARWAGQVPDDFRFTLKTPRAITHDRGASDAVGPMRAFVESTRELGHKLAAILIQYPPALSGRAWPEVEKFLDALPDGPRYAVEFREESWFRDDVIDGLRKRGICLVAADYNQKQLEPIVATSDWLYLRLIGVHGTYEAKTRERTDRTERLVWWRDAARRAIAGMSSSGEAVAMLNNDYAGFSIGSADKLRRLVGHTVTSEQERLGTLF